MAKKITYANKQTLYTDPAIGEEYKVTSGDMNEIKEVVNENLDSAANKLGMTISADGMLTIELQNADGEIIDSKQAKVVTDLSEYATRDYVKEYVDSLNSEEVLY